MKKQFSYFSLHFLFSILSAIVLITSCKNFDKTQPGASEKRSDNKNILDGDEQDGIAELQKWEFEMTKDVSLGYVPLDRLINATEELKTARLNGTYANRLSALSWAERGPNSDAVGPSNGNGRLGASVTSGRMRAIWVDLSDATGKYVWTGGVDGGVWNTLNITVSPATWTLANDFLGNLSISDITQDPTNHNNMYFATGERTINIDAVKGGGVWRSTDHGVTWTLCPGTSTFWNASRVVCDAAGNVYVSVVASLVGPAGSTGGIYRSTDGGSTWSANISPAGLSSRVTEMVISSTGRMHVTCGYYNTTVGSSGYRYTDIPATATSASWTAPATAFTPVQYNCDLAVAGTTLYALPSSSAFQTPQVWKSTDGGANWAITASTPTTGGATPVSSGQAWYNLGIAVDPSDANKVMVGGLNSYKTTDGGGTWSVNSVWVTGVPGSTNYIHADHQVIVWHANNVVLDGGDGGIFYSGDDGVTFADRNVGLRLKQFYACAIHPTSTNYFLAGAQDNGVHQLNGAGITSSVEVTGGDGAFVHIDENEPAYQWGSYVYNNYRRSTNSGATWSAPTADNNGSFINPTDYDDINNIMYCGRNANQYNRWANAQTGGTLTTVAMAGLGGGFVSHVKVSPYNTNRVFFGGGNDPSLGTGGGKILRADNSNGVPTVTDITGSGMTANTTVSCITVGTTDNNLLATFSNYGISHVWFSTVGGGAAGWTDITGTGLPDIPVRWAMFNPEDNDKAILATEMGIYETTDINGASTVWVQNGTLPVVKTNMLQYRFNDNTILASTHGRGLWTSTFTPVAPYVRFASSYTYSPVRTEATTTTTGCRSYTDYTLNMHIDMAPVGAAVVTLTIAGGATATQGVDYDFTTNGSFAAPSSVVTFPNGSTADQPITIRVYNDVEVDAAATESFTFNYSIGGGTDALPAPSSTYYTFYIADNDVAPTSTAVETVAGRTMTEHIGNNGTYYFYGSTGGLLLNSITGATGNLGCVTSTIFEAGTTWQTLLGGLRSQKVFEITPTTNPGSTYTVNLYFTTAELAGQVVSSLKIAKTTAATMAGVTSGNTVVASTTNALYNGTNYVFTATFTGFSKFFLINPAVSLPVDLISFSGYLNGQDHTALQWQTTNQYNLNNFEVQRSYDAVQFATIGIVNALQNPALIQGYNYTDPAFAKAVNFYRLKMVDFDGHTKYSAVIRINNTKPQKFVDLVQNPVRDNIAFILNNKDRENVVAQLFNSSGQLVKRWELGNIVGYVILPFNGSQPAVGIYTLRISAGNGTENLKIVVQ